MRIRTIIVTGAIAVAALATAAVPASADQVCYDVHVVVDGDAVVDESGCLA